MLQLNVQWHVLLLLLKLSHTPTSVSDEVLKASDTSEAPKPSKETINWSEYLKEGFENFRPLSDNSVSIITEYMPVRFFNNGSCQM